MRWRGEEGQEKKRKIGDEERRGRSRKKRWREGERAGEEERKEGER